MGRFRTEMEQSKSQEILRITLINPELLANISNEHVLSTVGTFKDGWPRLWPLTFTSDRSVRALKFGLFIYISDSVAEKSQSAGLLLYRQTIGSLFSSAWRKLKVDVSVETRTTVLGPFGLFESIAGNCWCSCLFQGWVEKDGVYCIEQVTVSTCWLNRKLDDVRCTEKQTRKGVERKQWEDRRTWQDCEWRKPKVWKVGRHCKWTAQDKRWWESWGDRTTFCD